MSDIPNTEYLTINQKGIFIGGQPAVYYCGEKLHSQSLIKTYFDYIQEKFSIIQDIKLFFVFFLRNLFCFEVYINMKFLSYICYRILI